MGKRAAGEGSITFWEKKNLWVAKVTLPDGKRKTKYGHTQKEVKDWLLVTRKALIDGIYVENDRMTVEEFLELYLKDYAATSVRASTFRSYSNMMHWHIIPEIGKVKLIKLDAKRLNHLYAQKLEEGLSNRTVEYIHGLLRRAFNKAILWGLLKFNPTKGASPPKLEKKTPTTWTAPQVKIFLDSLTGDRWRSIYVLALGTGMREGEILALKKDNLNLDQGYLKVVETVQFIQGKGLVFSEPKTANSKRLLTLPDFVVTSLREHLIHQEALQASAKWQDHGLVFTTNIGTTISPRNLIRHFKRKSQEAGLPEIRFHDLRHTVATLLLEKNTHPLIVSSLLGHSSVNLTLSVYSHVLPNIQKEATDKLNEMFK